MSTEQPVALVTGSGQGIGRGIAIELAAEGYCVVVNARRADPANTTSGPYEVKACIEQAGGRAEVIRGDISSAGDRQAIAEFLATRFDRLDLLVNNAGIAPPERKDILDASEESFDKVIGINLKGPYFLTQLLANKMIAWKQSGRVYRPRIVFVTSISAYTASTNRGEYCVSKAGLHMAAQLFAVRLAEHDIPVIEIAPGIIETPMTAGVKDKYDRLIAGGLLPTARWGTPHDVARMVVAVSRGDFDYATGACVEVGGGFGLGRL